MDQLFCDRKSLLYKFIHAFFNFPLEFHSHMIDSFHRTVKSCTKRKMNPYPHLLRTLMANHIVYCLNKKKADTSPIRVIPRRILCCNKLQRTVSGNLFSKFLQTMSIQHHKCDLMFILFLKILRDLLIRRPLLIKILFSAYRNLTFLTFQLSATSTVFVNCFPLTTALLNIIMRSLLII